MSKSPYLSNPNILAHPDRIVQKVELDMTAQDSYLAGSPISAEGKLANDASAIGILLYDVHKAIGGRTGVVVIFGRIKQDVAAEHSGITISAEAKAALIDITFTGDGCRMGGGGLTELPEGYPYKEKAFEDITWDGDTTGKTAFSLGDGDMYKVSDATPDFNILAGATVIKRYLDETFVEEGKWTSIPYGDSIIAAQFGSDVLVVYDGTALGVENGVYFNFAEDEFTDKQYTESLVAPETIHTMAPEFLPAGVGGGGAFVVNVTLDDSNNPTSMDKTFAELVDAINGGKNVVCRSSAPYFNLFLPVTSYVPDAAILFSCANYDADGPVLWQFSVAADGNMSFSMTALSAS